MERAEAEAILDGERGTAVALLLRVGELVEANRRLDRRPVVVRSSTGIPATRPRRRPPLVR